MRVYFKLTIGYRPIIIFIHPPELLLPFEKYLNPPEVILEFFLIDYLRIIFIKLEKEDCKTLFQLVLFRTFNPAGFGYKPIGKVILFQCFQTRPDVILHKLHTIIK